MNRALQIVMVVCFATAAQAGPVIIKMPTNDDSKSDPVDAVREEVEKTAARFNFIIDFLKRTADLSPEQERLLRTAAKGTGEGIAETTFENYGTANVAHVGDVFIQRGGIVVEQQRFFFGGHAQDPLAHPIWKRTLKRVLSDEQETALADAKKKRTKAGSSLLARLDLRLYFDEAQRKQLDPLLKGKGHQRDDQFISPAELSGIDKYKIKAILSEAQFKGWSDIMQGKTQENDPFGNRIKIELPQ